MGPGPMGPFFGGKHGLRSVGRPHQNRHPEKTWAPFSGPQNKKRLLFCNYRYPVHAKSLSAQATGPWDHRPWWLRARAWARGPGRAHGPRALPHGPFIWGYYFPYYSFVWPYYSFVWPRYPCALTLSGLGRRMPEPVGKSMYTLQEVPLGIIGPEDPHIKGPWAHLRCPWGRAHRPWAHGLMGP